MYNTYNYIYIYIYIVHYPWAGEPSAGRPPAQVGGLPPPNPLLKGLGGSNPQPGGGG